MARRTPQQQSKHDKKVLSIARRLQREGWRVEADLDGWDRPDSIAGRVPDIVAWKAGAKRIVEVETKESEEKDRKQHSAFRRHAGQFARVTFELVVV